MNGAAKPEAVRGRPPKLAGAPHGRAQVIPAVIAAATELFASQGIGAVSVRQIARHAGVNPALVARYVGDKDALVDAVLDGLLAQITPQLDQFMTQTGSDLPPFPPGAMDLYFRIATHLVVEGGDLRGHRAEFPLIRRVVAILVSRDGLSEAEARRRGAQIFTLELASRLFGQSLLHAAGLGPDDAHDLLELVHQVSAHIATGTMGDEPFRWASSPPR